MHARGMLLLIGGFVLAAAWPGGDAFARKEPLLSFSQGQLPSDTASDGATKLSLDESSPLGGKALKVVFASGDAFGDRVSKIKDWKQFISLQFEAFNPAPQDVRLTLTVKHKRSTSYQTRVDYPFVLKPGRNAIVLGVDEMLNVNGSAPDLSDVSRWYIACEEGATPTLYFGDICLVGDDLPAATTAPALAPGGAVIGSAQTYKVTGKIGEMPVDLTVTPIGGAISIGIYTPAAATKGNGRIVAVQAVKQTAGHLTADPARLARIRAAKMPAIAGPVMFDTPAADAILTALEVFPPDNPWNQVVAGWPLHPKSAAIVASIGAEKPLRCNPDMGFILVPPTQKRAEVKIVDYAGESDPGPFPVPENMPIEGWPAGYQRDASVAALTLDDVQRDKLGRGGDRHAIVVDPVNRMLYEFYQAKRTDGGWQAAQASVFDLKTNKLRPEGWTSTDAAGLPIFPAVVRYDELQRGIVEHAMRVTVRKSRRAYTAPATHFASPHENEEYPRMGERLRLKQDYDVSGFSPEVQAILKGLKKYGMFVADNGIEWAISVAPDPRIPVLHEELRKLKGADFEVVLPP